MLKVSKNNWSTKKRCTANQKFMKINSVLSVASSLSPTLPFLMSRRKSIIIKRLPVIKMAELKLNQPIFRPTLLPKSRISYSNTLIINPILLTGHIKFLSKKSKSGEVKSSMKTCSKQ
jgi:hypothetical protein